MCEHLHLQFEAGMAREFDPQSEQLVGYKAEIRLKCEDCGCSFIFTHPTVSGDRKELRARVVPVANGPALVSRQ